MKLLGTGSSVMQGKLFVHFAKISIFTNKYLVLPV